MHRLFNVAASTANLQRDYPYELNSDPKPAIQIQTVLTDLNYALCNINKAILCNINKAIL